MDAVDTVEERPPEADERGPSGPLSMSVADAADKLGIEPRWLKERVREGIIPGFRLDRKSEWRITFETFRRILAGGFNDAPSVTEVRREG